MTEKDMFPTTGNLMGADYQISHYKMSRLNTEPAEIAEKQRLLEWLKYNDFMYFEKIEKSGAVNCKEQYWFQTYVNMPLKTLRKKVTFISTLMNGEKSKYSL